MDYELIISLGVVPCVHYYEMTSALVDTYGSLWMMHIYMERKEGAIDGLAQEIEFRLFRQLMNGLQIDFMQGDMIMRPPAFFFLYGPHPATIVCTDPLSKSEAAQVKEHLIRFMSHYTEG